MQVLLILSIEPDANPSNTILTVDFRGRVLAQPFFNLTNQRSSAQRKSIQKCFSVNNFLIIQLSLKFLHCTVRANMFLESFSRTKTVFFYEF